jgi:hypothetical protein
MGKDIYGSGPPIDYESYLREGQKSQGQPRDLLKKVFGYGALEPLLDRIMPMDGQTEDPGAGHGATGDFGPGAPDETSSFGDDFNSALDQAAGRPVDDKEALDFMNSDEGQHAVAIWNMEGDDVNADPKGEKIKSIGEAYDLWKRRRQTVPEDLMSGNPKPPMVEPVAR